MYGIPRSYISVCSYSVQYVSLYLILMSILFHHYKQLSEFISHIEQIEVKVERLLLLDKKEEKEDNDS
jgi:hypothetical protein